MEMELKDKDDVGAFVSYNEKTGRALSFRKRTMNTSE